MYEDYEALTVICSNGILRVTMNNPPLNAASVRMHDELLRVFAEAQNDDACTLLILTGAGKAFSAGGDFELMRQALDDPALRNRLVSCGARLVQTLLGFDKPTLARVNGHAIGLGATLALLCDVVIASQDAKIGDPHVAVGLSAGDGGSLIWPLLVGYARARHHLLTGELLTARQAQDIGLIHKAVAQDTLDAEVDDYAARLMSLSSLAVRATKRSINMPLCAQAAALADAHMGLELQTMGSREHREAVMALVSR